MRSVKPVNLLAVIVSALMAFSVLAADESTFSEGVARFENNEYFDAEAIFRELVNQNPDNPSSLQMLARVLMVWNRYEEAEQYLIRAKRTADDISVNVDLAKIYLATGQLEKAQDVVRYLGDKNVDVAEMKLEINYGYGVRMFEDQDFISARNYFQVVAKTQKGYRDTDRYLREIRKTGENDEYMPDYESVHSLELTEAKLAALEKEKLAAIDKKMNDLRTKEAEIEYLTFQKELEMKKKGEPALPGPVSPDFSAFPIPGTMVGAVYFNTGSAVLSQAALNALRKILDTIRVPGKKIIIAGHTDSDPFRGKNRDNLELSVSRALSVKRHLAAQGIDKDLIEIKGLGSSYPASQEKSQNRRAEIYLD